MIRIEYIPPTAAQWMELVSFTNWKEHTLSTFESALKNSLFFVTAYDDNEIIGMAQIVGDGILSFYIQYLVVKPCYRKKGIGKELVLHAINKIKNSCDPDAIIALFSSSINVSFYSKLGFIARPNETQGPAMVYPLDI